MTLRLAPGGRYRLDGPDWHARGNDGERGWNANRPGAHVSLPGGQPPFPALLAPSWLLGGYRLTIEGETTACGRAGVRVTAAPWRDEGQGPGPGAPPWGGLTIPPPSHFRSHFLYDEVSAIVDAELGILLSCDRRKGDHVREQGGFVSLTTDPEIDPAAFSAPAGSVFEGEWGADGPSGWPTGWEAMKTVAGLAAGGLGAAIKFTPRRRPDPFARATAEDDQETAMLPGCSSVTCPAARRSRSAAAAHTGSPSAPVPGIRCPGRLPCSTGWRSPLWRRWTRSRGGCWC